MKLKKLIPLAGIAGVAAIAAPLVTSCSNNKGTLIKWTPGTDTPRLDPVEREYSYSAAPTDAGLDSIVKAINDATNDYFQDIKKDPNLFSKDMLKQWETIYKEAPAPLAGYQWKEATIHVSKVDTKNQTISYETYLRFENSTSLDDKTPTIEINLEAKNIRFKVMRSYYGEGTTSITPVIMSTYMTNMPNSGNLPVIVSSWEEALQQDYVDVMVDDSWSMDISVDSNTRIPLLPSSTSIHWDHTNVALNIEEMWAWDDYVSYDFLLASLSIVSSAYLNITWIVEH